MSQPSKRTNTTSTIDVDRYIDHIADTDKRIALIRLRAVIRQAAPKAEEKISYGMIAYFHDGMLVGFAAFKGHCGFYIMSPSTTKRFATKLKGFSTAAATVRFTPERPIPAALVKAIVKARMRENRGRA